MIMVEDNIVIVIDTSNYINSFAEEVPFKAKVIDKYDINIIVKSLHTNKEYELYYHQILEGLDIDETEDEKKANEELKASYEPVCKKVKEILDAKVEKVVVSLRMEESPCVLVTSEFGWTANMERIMKAQALRDNSMTGHMVSKKTMEINPKHGIIKELKSLLDKDPSNATIKDIVWLLFDTSLLSSGFSIEDPNTFASRMHKMLLFGISDDTSVPAETTNTTETNNNATTKTEKNTFLDECD